MDFLTNGEPSSPLSSVADFSDSEISELSRSPTPPSEPSLAKQLASPSSSRRSSVRSTPQPQDMPSPPSSNDDARPRKRRKLANAKERTTERLDLSGTEVPEDQQAQLQRLLNVLHKKRKIVVIAGAGISVSAGIPDFRSATGLFNSLKKEHKLKSSGRDLFDASVYQDDSSTSTFHDMVRTLSQHTKSAQPTAFHHLLATLAEEGRLMRLYTQNVDGIDTSLEPLKTQIPFPKKGPWPKTVQVHGGLDYMVCSKCHELKEFDAAKFNGPTPPPCDSCLEIDTVRRVSEKRSHGIGCLRPRMVLYNEYNPDAEAIGACTTADLQRRPDAVIVAGTTLKVPGVRRIAREMCKIVRDRRDGVAIWINNDPEPLGKELEDVWDLVVKGPCDEVARHANMRRWDDKMEYKEVTDAEISKVKEKVKPEIRVNVILNAGQLTPGQSPRMQAQDMVKEEQPTPSKKSQKRKVDALQMNLSGKAATKAPAKRKSAQPKKPTTGKSRGKKAGNQEGTAMNTLFKATKGTAKTAAKTAAEATDPAVTRIKSEHAAQPTPVPKENAGDTIHSEKRLSIPKKPRPVTSFKLQELSNVDPRTNSSLNRPDMEPFTPANSPVKARTPSGQLRDESGFSFSSSPASGSRPSSATSQMNETIHPPSCPLGMGKLLN